MLRLCSPDKRASGHLLSELLVSLGLLFFTLTAGLAILDSATRSSKEAAVRERALSLARSGIEKVIASPESERERHIRSRFGAGRNPSFETIYERDIWIRPLEGELFGLYRVVVDVEWGDGSQRVRLERYVR